MKKENYMISIIIPCYNSFKKMNKCLLSLENQKFTDFEVIIIDDCSTDNSFEELEKYVKESKLNINLIENIKNCGAGESRNIGIRNAKGKYLMFIDSDDYINNNTLKVLNDIFTKDKDIDCICFDYYKERNDNSRIPFDMIIGCIGNKIIDTKEVLINIRGCTCGKIYLSKNIKENNIIFEKIVRNEDMPFTKVAISYCKKIYYYKELPLYYYIDNKDSLMHNNRLLDENNAIFAFNCVEKKINKDMKDELESIFISECLYSIICTTVKRHYSKKKIKKIINNQILKYKNWYKNKKIKKMPIYKRTILFFYRINVFFPIRIIMKIKRWFYV